MTSTFPKVLTAAVAALFLSIAPASAQQNGGPDGSGQADVQPEFELDDRVSPEHRLLMGETFRGLGMPATEVMIDPIVGAAVPVTAVRHPVPPAIIATVPETEGYDYVVLSDGRTALVHPGTNTIAMILD